MRVPNPDIHVRARPDPRSRWLAAVLAALTLLLFGPGPGPALAAQDTAPASQNVSSEVQIQIDSFGVGNVARRGDWAGIRFRIMDTAARERELVVRLAVSDPDGDRPMYQRELTANPGVSQGVWMYARLPFGFEPGQDMVFSVHEAEIGGGGEAGDTGYTAGRLLGRMIVTPNGRSVLPATEAMFTVVGGRAMGLRAYSTRANPQDAWLPIGNELTEVVLGVQPADLPDRWMGLIPTSTLVWGSGDPAELRGDRARAVREWVERGGHLVIVLPSVGQTWTNPASSDLYDLLPAVVVERREGVDLNAYRPLLTRRATTSLPTNATVHTFSKSAGALPAEASIVLAAPDGTGVVARRLVGAGAVTLVGIDLNTASFNQADAFEAEVFWHRVLGRRNPLSLPEDTNSGFPLAASRNATVYDNEIASIIARTGRSAAAVLLGFVVFGLYWLIAGPVGYALLKMRKLSHHAWLAFVGAAIVFTVLAWGGATMLRPAKVEATHLTLLDHTYGQPYQRARMWASVMVPWDGSATISVGDPVLAEAGLTNRLPGVVAPWEAYSTDLASGVTFPDARGYVIDTRSPDSFTFPTRSTTKQVRVDWSDGPVWKMPRPVSDEDQLRLTSSAEGAAASVVQGRLIHEMPGTLTDAYIVVVRRTRPLESPRRVVNASDAMPTVAVAYSLPIEGWPSGETLDLSLVTAPQRGDNSSSAAEFFLRRFRYATGGFGISQRPEGANREDKLTSLAFFPVLPAPELGANDDTARYAALRTATHTYDLGRWFTQPCVIIVGHLGPERESPVPLALDGKRVPTSGRTVVRWVYPLPDDPPAYPASVVEAPAQDTQPAANDGG